MFSLSVIVIETKILYILMFNNLYVKDTYNKFQSDIRFPDIFIRKLIEINNQIKSYALINEVMK